jgi:hypothetical protein
LLSYLNGRAWIKRVVERVLRRIFGPKREEIRGAGEKYIMKIFITSPPRQILLG